MGLTSTRRRLAHLPLASAASRRWASGRRQVASASCGRMEDITLQPEWQRHLLFQSPPPLRLRLRPKRDPPSQLGAGGGARWSPSASQPSPRRAGSPERRWRGAARRRQRARTPSPWLARAPRSPARTTMDVSSVLDSLKASVVSIDTTISVRQGPYTQSGSAAGTGIVLDDQGHIITNAHVVDGATSVTVTVDGSSAARTATIVATDTTNVAVLQVADTTGLVPATFAPACRRPGRRRGDRDRQRLGARRWAQRDRGHRVGDGPIDRHRDGDTLTGLLQTDAQRSAPATPAEHS